MDLDIVDFFLLKNIWLSLFHGIQIKINKLVNYMHKKVKILERPDKVSTNDADYVQEFYIFAVRYMKHMRKILIFSPSFN